MQHQQHPSEVCNEGPIRPWRPPLPEIIWSVRNILVLEREMRGRRSVRERDVEEEQVDADHEQCLDQQRGAEVGAEPVVDFQDAGDEHDERNVEGEAGGAAGSVHAVDLVAIAGNRTRRDTACCLLETERLKGCGVVQDGCDVPHNGADEEHVGGRVLGPAVRLGTSEGFPGTPFTTLECPTTMEETHTQPRDRFGAIGRGVRLERHNTRGRKGRRRNLPQIRSGLH